MDRLDGSLPADYERLKKDARIYFKPLDFHRRCA
jgi:hypothetical protein